MISQKIVASDEMAEFLDSYREKQMNVNILTVQPHTFEKEKDGCWRVKKYLWVYIPIQPQQVATPQTPPIIIPRPGVGKN